MLHIFNRLLQMVLIVALLSFALFGLLSAMPGNPVDMLVTSNPRVKPEDIVRLKKLRGLDKPWYVQYLRWIWGYHDALRPPIVDSKDQIELSIADNGLASFAFNIEEMLHDADARFTVESLTQIVSKEKPKIWQQVTEWLALSKNSGKNTDRILEKIAFMDSDYYGELLQQLRKQSLQKLEVIGLFGATAEGFSIHQTFYEPGEKRVWFIVRNETGLETVSTIPIRVTGKTDKIADTLMVLPIDSQVVDNPARFGVDLAQHVLAPTGRENLQFDLINDSPGTIDENGRFTHIFDDPGQTVISYSVRDSKDSIAYGAFAVEHGPIPDRKRFNRGFLFVFAGDKDALGFSSTYKRPVWELLAGTEAVCGNRRIEPGESCDDGNLAAGDGCSVNCQVEGSSIMSKAESILTGWLSSSGRISNTLQLMLPAILLSLVFALPLGILSAYRQYSWLDYLVNFFAFIGISLPVFWFAIMMIFFFAEYLQWFPAGGIQTPGMRGMGLFDVLLDKLQHAILPVLVLSIAYTGRWLRYMRSSMLEILPSDFVRTARAKGLSESVVILKHALRNAMIPVVTVLSLSIPALFGGAVLTETVFSWPGIGRLQYDAVMNSDYYVAIVVFLIAAVLVMVGNLFADLLYVIVDPRIRHR